MKKENDDLIKQYIPLGLLGIVCVILLLIYGCKGLERIPHNPNKKLPERKGMVSTPLMDIHKSALTKDQIAKYKQL